MLEQLETEVRLAAALIKDTRYTQDPWLWDLDWKPASLRTKKRKFLDKLITDELLTDKENKFPSWFQDLADEEDGRVFLNISTSKRVVPKILKLTWKGFPLHFDKTEKPPCGIGNEGFQTIHPTALLTSIDGTQTDKVEERSSRSVKQVWSRICVP